MVLGRRRHNSIVRGSSWRGGSSRAIDTRIGDSLGPNNFPAAILTLDFGKLVTNGTVVVTSGCLEAADSGCSEREIGQD